VREYSTPMSVTIPATGSLTDDVVTNGEQHPDAVVFSRRTAEGWRGVRAAEFLAEVRRTAKGLVAAGIGSGDRVALLSKTRYEWTLIDYAIWYVGAVTVPIYDTASADHVEWILSDSGACAAIVETDQHVDRVERVRGSTSLEQLWAIDRGVGGADEGAVAALSRLGEGVRDEALEERRRSVSPGDVATLTYTSGTYGRPKGCVLTHGNLMTEAAVTTDELRELFEGDGGDRGSTLLLLPLAHVFARIIQVGAVRTRTRLGHCTDIRHLLEDLATFRPTFLLAIPRVFEKIFNSASQQAASDGRGRRFDRATDLAISWSRALDGPSRPGPLLRVQHALHDRLVYARLRTALGGRCRFAVSGGAPLGDRLGHFYRGIGVPVLEGYGLTETSGAATVNLPDAMRIGSVGRPLPGTAVRVSDEGELLVRGHVVMRGYWRDERATRAALDDDGWLHTGDLGEIDAEGFVRVTGRRKELLVTAGGKNVAPGLLENRLRAHHLVSQCMVVGDGRPYVAALVTIDPEGLSAWADRLDKKGTVPALVRDPDLVAEVQRAVDEANRTVSQAEWIRRFRILPVDWTDEGGQLTPSLKLRRNVVTREFRGDIDALYDS
jgi:long-chain acyl-CoA synthetase